MPAEALLLLVAAVYGLMHVLLVDVGRSPGSSPGAKHGSTHSQRSGGALTPAVGPTLEPGVARSDSLPPAAARRVPPRDRAALRRRQGRRGANPRPPSAVSPP